MSSREGQVEKRAQTSYYLFSKTIELVAGDTLVLYTDGLTERKNKDGKQYGNKKMIQIFKKFVRANPEKLLVELKTDWEEFCRGNRRDDDTCLLAVKVV